MAEIVWCNRVTSFSPFPFGFCPDKKTWKKYMKEMKIKEPYPKSMARCSFFESKDEKFCLVTLRKDMDKGDLTNALGLLVHEATHIWQFIRTEIGEKEPAIEQEAYAIQQISGNLIEAYFKTRRPIDG